MNAVEGDTTLKQASTIRQPSGDTNEGDTDDDYQFEGRHIACVVFGVVNPFGYSFVSLLPSK